MASRRPNEREGVHGLHFGPYHHSLNRLSAPAQMRTTSNHAEYKISQTFRAVHKRKVPLADICHHGLYRTHFFGKHDLALVKFHIGQAQSAYRYRPIHIRSRLLRFGPQGPTRKSAPLAFGRKWGKSMMPHMAERDVTTRRGTGKGLRHPKWRVVPKVEQQKDSHLQ